MRAFRLKACQMRHVEKTTTSHRTSRARGLLTRTVATDATSGTHGTLPPVTAAPFAPRSPVIRLCGECTTCAYKPAMRASVGPRCAKTTSLYQNANSLPSLCRPCCLSSVYLVYRLRSYRLASFQTSTEAEPLSRHRSIPPSTICHRRNTEDSGRAYWYLEGRSSMSVC